MCNYYFSDWPKSKVADQKFVKKRLILQFNTMAKCFRDKKAGRTCQFCNRWLWQICFCEELFQDYWDFSKLKGIICSIYDKNWKRGTKDTLKISPSRLLTSVRRKKIEELYVSFSVKHLPPPAAVKRNYSEGKFDCRDIWHLWRRWMYSINIAAMHNRERENGWATNEMAIARKLRTVEVYVASRNRSRWNRRRLVWWLFARVVVVEYIEEVCKRDIAPRRFVEVLKVRTERINVELCCQSGAQRIW